jgi:hypothetical protein
MTSRRIPVIRNLPQNPHLSLEIAVPEKWSRSNKAMRYKNPGIITEKGWFTDVPPGTIVKRYSL